MPHRQPKLPALPIREPDTSMYPLALKTFHCFGTGPRTQPLVDMGIDERTAAAYLAIVDRYDRDIEHAEAAYRDAVAADGCHILDIVAAHCRRAEGYSAAESVAAAAVLELSEQTGYPVAPRTGRR